MIYSQLAVLAANCMLISETLLSTLMKMIGVLGLQKIQDF